MIAGTWTSFDQVTHSSPGSTRNRTALELKWKGLSGFKVVRDFSSEVTSFLVVQVTHRKPSSGDPAFRSQSLATVNLLCLYKQSQLIVLYFGKFLTEP